MANVNTTMYELHLITVKKVDRCNGLFVQSMNSAMNTRLKAHMWITMLMTRFCTFVLIKTSFTTCCIRLTLSLECIVNCDELIDY